MSTPRRWAYRFGQGLRAIVPRVNHAQRDAALLCLPPAARSAFLAMPANDQCHHLDVYRLLRHEGCQDTDVLAAALLHDVGKTTPLGRVGVWQRVVVVLLAPWPGLLLWLARPPAAGWRRGFAVHARHAELGAALARQVGCSARTVTLIAAHQDGATRDAGLLRLRAADDRAL